MLKSYLNKGVVEAGIDEAGRGCLAGPVVAAAVILPESFEHPLLNDSKKMSESDRLLLREVILKEALAWSVSFVEPEVIDKINILNATFKAMNDSVKSLGLMPQLLLIDGNRFKNATGIEHKCIVKGDAQYASIAAASVLAKTYRDDLMTQLHKQYEGFCWDKNKGYPTMAHRQAIRRFGITEHHRKSFRILPEEIQALLFP